MIKRTLYFSNPAYLSLKNGQMMIDLRHLQVLGDEDSKKTVPIEDVGIVILDHQQITITHGCIAALLDNNAAIITCSSTHHPTGMMLPIDGHDTQSERFRYQIDASQPLKKQLWQQTIQAKILNQAAVLADRGTEYENMLYWAKSVRSGDPDNYEGRAAAYYWKNVFPKKSSSFVGGMAIRQTTFLTTAMPSCVQLSHVAWFAQAYYQRWVFITGINIMLIVWLMILWNLIDHT